VSLQRARADSPTWRRSRYVPSSRAFARPRVSLAPSRAAPATPAIDAHPLGVSASQDPASAKADEEKKDWTHAYADDLQTDIYTEVNADPKATVHSTEWRKIMRGDPVEINPSVGSGLKIMTVDEWTSRWKRNDRFPECLACGGTATKEHHFMQTWCRGKKQFESETLCMDCHMFSWRSYSDPGLHAAGGVRQGALGKDGAGQSRRGRRRARVNDVVGPVIRSRREGTRQGRYLLGFAR
jgi:hypothetical protein